MSAGIMVEASKHVGQWRNDVMSAAAAAHRGTPITGPVRLEIVFLFPGPSRTSGPDAMLASSKPAPLCIASAGPMATRQS